MLKKEIPASDLDNLHQRLELLMINTEEPFVLVDKAFNVFSFNDQFKKQYLKYFGLEVLRGHCILDYAQPHRVEMLKKLYQDVFIGETKESQIEIPFPDNTKRTYLTKYKPALNERGEIIGAFVSSVDITEQLVLKESQRVNEKRFQALIENASEIISLTDENGKLIYISPSAFRVTGYSYDELKDDGYFSKMHPDYKGDSPKIRDEAKQNPGVPIYRLNRFVHKNGDDIWMEGTVTNLLHDANVSAIVSNFRNITERKKAEEELKETKNNLKAIFDSSEEAFILLDKNCIIKIFNSKAKKNSSFGVEDLKIGTNFFDYIPDERKSHFKDQIIKVLNGETVEYDINHVDKKNITFWFHATLSPVKLDDAIDGVCITRRDITSRKKIEEELRVNEVKYKLLSEELAISNTELEQFAYMASHDLQEPLRMISSFMTQLEIQYKDSLDERAKQYIYYATDGAARMRKIILNLLEYSLAGRKNVETELIDINELLLESIKLNRKVIEETSATIEWKNLPAIQGNRTCLQQLFQNLIGNALKYKKNNEKPEIKLTASETSTHWQFLISDNGIGIEAHFFEKIFVVFQRLHTKDEYSGTGLGLAICKKIVENHGGKIWLESKPNEGSTFYFTILK